MNKLVKKLFTKGEQVAFYSDPTLDAAYENIYQSIRNQNAHLLQPPSNTPSKLYRFYMDMSHELQCEIMYVARKLINNANDAAHYKITFKNFPGAVPLNLQSGKVAYLESWIVDALKLKARLSIEYKITDLRNILNFVYRRNPITDTEKWTWEQLRSLILSHLSYADQIIGIADFLNGLIRHQKNSEKPIKGVRSIRDDLQSLTIHQLEVWIRDNTEELKNAIQPDAIMQVYAGICDIRNNMICKGDLRPARHYVKAQHKGTDGQKVMAKEICDALGISRPTLSRLLKDPDNAWGLTPTCISSWRFFNLYRKTHQTLIEEHKANPKSKVCKPKVKALLTRTGDISDGTQSATQPFKPDGQKPRKQIKYVTPK